MSQRSTRSSSKTPQSKSTLPLELTEFEISQLLDSKGIKPSTLTSTSKPLIVLSPEELNELVELEQEQAEEEEGEMALWEEALHSLFWSIPFAFLFYGLDSAVHAQFGMNLIFSQTMSRVFTLLLTIFALTFFLSRPNFLPPLATQFLLLSLCLSTGITLIHITTTESYLKVMKMAPGLGTLWCWSIVRLDLVWAVVGLVGVAGGVWFRGEGKGVIWW